MTPSFLEVAGRDTNDITSRRLHWFRNEKVGVTRMAHSKRRPQEGRTYHGPSIRERVWHAAPLSVRNAVYQRQVKKRRDYLRQIEDRRDFHPEGQTRPARSFSSFHHRLRIKGIPLVEVTRPSGYQWKDDSYQPLPYRVGFVRPERVLICVRRKIRREIMHALRFAGGSGNRRPNYNEYSSVSC